jgi:GntR family transcriptional regulator
MEHQPDLGHLWAGEEYPSTPLDQRVAERLRMMIVAGELRPESRLPNEPALSSLLGVSRSTVRSSLTILEHSGYVLRRRGIGTFVAMAPPHQTSLNVNSGVTELIRSSGAEPGTVELLIAERPAGKRASERLGVEPDSPLVVVERVRLANAQRVIFTVDCFAASLFRKQGKQITAPEIEAFLAKQQSMYALLRQLLSVEVHHGFAYIRPLTAESYIAEKLRVPHGSSLLHIEQVDFTADGMPIALSDEYYIADAFAFSVYRSS